MQSRCANIGVQKLEHVLELLVTEEGKLVICIYELAASSSRLSCVMSCLMVLENTPPSLESTVDQHETERSHSNKLAMLPPVLRT